jgi:hypothetical protein
MNARAISDRERDQKIKEKEAKQLINDLMVSNNVDRDLINADEFSRFVQYIILWVEIIADDDGSDDE